MSELGEVPPPGSTKKSIDPKHRRRAFAAMLIASVIFALLALKWASEPAFFEDTWDNRRISIVASNAVFAILSAGSAWAFRSR